MNSPPQGTGGSVFGTLTDHSGSITTAGTAQNMMAGNARRRYLLFQNHSNGNLWIDFGEAATQSSPSVRLFAGQSFSMEGQFVDNEAISIIGGTAGATFVAKEGQ